MYYDNAGRRVKIKEKFRKIAEVYATFSKIKRYKDAPNDIIKIWDEYDSYRDYSEEALNEFFLKESYGEDFSIKRENGKINGYVEGQQWFNLTKTEYWKPDIKSKELKKEKLYNNEIPEWFLDKVIKDL